MSGFSEAQSSQTYHRNAGYGQSKLAAEQILAAASRQAGVPVSIVRIGQVGGSRRGNRVWADQPWISAIIRTSKTLGSFPSPVVPVDWASVDNVANILESVALRPLSKSQLLEVFNVVTDPQPWSVLIDAVREIEPAAVQEVISLPEWVGKLRHLLDPASADITALPALRLLDFYDGLGHGHGSAKYATANSRAVSSIALASIDQELLVSWLKTWGL